MAYSGRTREQLTTRIAEIRGAIARIEESTYQLDLDCSHLSDTSGQRASGASGTAVVTAHLAAVDAAFTALATARVSLLALRDEMAVAVGLS